MSKKQRDEPQDVRHMALGLNGPWDVLGKFEWELELYRQLAAERVPAHDLAYRQVLYPMYAAINAASTAWSHVEWVWFEVEGSDAIRSWLLDFAGAEPNGELPQLKKALRRKFREVDACHQMAHATKHAKLTHGITAGFSAEPAYGIWISADEEYHFTAEGKIQFDHSGSAEPVDAILDFMAVWWRSLLEHLRIPDPARLVPRQSERDG